MKITSAVKNAKNAKNANDVNNFINSHCIDAIKELFDNHVTEQILQKPIKHTQPGSISYLLFGDKPSDQSISIKFGHMGEYLSKELIKANPTLELLTCGIQKINNKNKDVDLIWKDDLVTTIHYFELKSNIELDTEKLPATINKCKEIKSSLEIDYPNYIINCGILNWSVYNRQILTSGLSNIKSFEKNGVKIYHMGDFLHLINIEWAEDDFYSYFTGVGTKINTYLENI
jgi:hypothetical protein